DLVEDEGLDAAASLVEAAAGSTVAGRRAGNGVVRQEVGDLAWHAKRRAPLPVHLVDHEHPGLVAGATGVATVGGAVPWRGAGHRGDEALAAGVEHTHPRNAGRSLPLAGAFSDH